MGLFKVIYVLLLFFSFFSPTDYLTTCPVVNLNLPQFEFSIFLLLVLRT